MLNRKFLIILFLGIISFLYANEHKTIAFYTKNMARASEKDVRLAIHQILKSNPDKSGLVVDEVFPKSVNETIDGYVSKRYSLISLNVADFLANYNLLLPLTSNIWTLSRNTDKKYSTYMIVVKKKSNIKSFKNKKVAILRFNKMQKIFLGSYLLKKYHHDTGYFFKTIIPFDSSSQMLIRLFFSDIDACVVCKNGWDIATEMNPQLKKRLKIVQISKDIYPDIGFTIARVGEVEVSKRYNQLIHKKMSIDAISSILLIYKARSVRIYDKNTLKELYELYKNYFILKKKYDSR